MTGSNASIEDAFFAYAGERTGLSPEMLTDYLQKATEHCHLKQSLLGMTDVKGIRNALQNVSEGKLLRFRYGKDAQAIRNVTQLYYTFIKSHPELTEEPVIKAEESDAEAIVSEPSVDPQPDDTVEATEKSSDKFGITVPREKATEKPQMKKKTLKDVQPSEPKPYLKADSSGKIPLDSDYDWHRNGLRLVDLTGERSYTLTQPEAYEYNGVTHRVNTWEMLYVDLCGALFKDYPDAFKNLINRDVPGYKALAFADERHKNKMRVPSQFAWGLYLETSMDANSIVGRIRGLYRLLKLGTKLKISYMRQGDAKKIPATGKTDEE